MRYGTPGAFLNNAVLLVDDYKNQIQKLNMMIHAVVYQFHRPWFKNTSCTIPNALSLKNVYSEKFSPVSPEKRVQDNIS